MIEQHSINSDIKLNSYKVKFYDKKGSSIATGEVTSTQKFHPKPSLVFSGELESKEGFHSSNFRDGIKCEFIDLNQTVDILLTKVKVGKSPIVSFIISKAPLIIDKNKNLKTINFNLINFNKEVFNSNIEFHNWRLNLKQIVSNKDYEELSEVGGFLVTHVGKITKIDNTDFTVQEAESLSNFLYILFSFCKGVSTPPFLIEGFDSKGELSWTELGSRNLHFWKECNNWFTHSRIDLNNFVNGFYNFYQDKTYKNFFNEIIYWYTTIYGALNNYTALLIAHTALELISWIFLTKDFKVLSIDGYHKLSAGDSLSLTIGYNKIQSVVPQRLKNLVKLGNANNLNGPMLLSTIRNKIVHPPSKRRDDFTENGMSIFEAKILGTWYIELFILSKSNYNGKYSNILNYSGWKGEIEVLPWMKDT